MPKVLTNGKISIGAYKFPDRKRPSLCIEKGNEILVYGSFHNEQQASEFMNELGKLCGAVIESEVDAE
jgi:hypothetical protein